MSSAFPVQYDFSDQVAVVTGASAGIGFAIAERLRACGAIVSNWDLAPDGNDPLACQVDVTDAAALEAAAADLHQKTGRIDMLINNAGFAGPTTELWRYCPDTWQKIIDVNLVGVFNVCRAITPYMHEAKQGRIVNISSLAGKEGTPNASAYSAAKAGVLALTKSLGKELASSNVLVNAIAPAAVETELLKQMSPSHVQTMIDKSPMKRLGSVAEVAEMTAWLCSAACSFNTGAVFDLSGGRATY
ncbi:SDR family oxidoreductase [Paenalcaligenes niemegkensis]|uniref:SDR family NAD(P)-dependent oxidoreductase n=1 Tax=Paenalcaligenes niemegkensis TaxID=2895469 RepID=UPI001EE88BA1|nr:SDR family NAD(P)-dependent oxidoreductase [Paenalcaligenes niemegkensis]MCQ9618291.1 SDR family oxidoreductase [Paenalcaligenes niemegkensis]